MLDRETAIALARQRGYAIPEDTGPPAGALKDPQSATAAPPAVGTPELRKPPAVDLDTLFAEEDARNQLPPGTLRTLALAEHNGKIRPGAVSPKGARGVLQVTPALASDYGVTDPKALDDPVQNVRIAGANFAKHYRDYGGDLDMAIAAHNAGAGAVEKAGGIPDYPETRGLIERYHQFSMEPDTPVAKVGRLTPMQTAQAAVRAGYLTTQQASDRFGFYVPDPDLEQDAFDSAAGDEAARERLARRVGGVSAGPGALERGLTGLADEGAALALPAIGTLARGTGTGALLSGAGGAVAEVYRHARENPQATMRALSGSDAPGLAELGKDVAIAFGTNAVGEVLGRPIGEAISAGVKRAFRPGALEAERTLGPSMPSPSLASRPLQRVAGDAASALDPTRTLPPLREAPFSIPAGIRGTGGLQAALEPTMGSRTMFRNVRERANDAAMTLRKGYLEPVPDVGPVHKAIEAEAAQLGVQVPLGAPKQFAGELERKLGDIGGDLSLAKRINEAGTKVHVPPQPALLAPNGQVILPAKPGKTIIRPSLEWDQAKRLRTDLLDEARAKYKEGLDSYGGELTQMTDLIDESMQKSLEQADPSGRLVNKWRDANDSTRQHYQQLHGADLIEKHTVGAKEIGGEPFFDGRALGEELRGRKAALTKALGPERYQGLSDLAQAAEFSQRQVAKGQFRYTLIPFAQYVVAGYMMRDALAEQQAPELRQAVAAASIFLAPALMSRLLTNPGLTKALVEVARHPEATGRMAALAGKLALAGTAMAYEDEQNSKQASTLPPPALAPVLQSKRGPLPPLPRKTVLPGPLARPSSRTGTPGPGIPALDRLGLQ